jgi:hypothetical protein
MLPLLATTKDTKDTTEIPRDLFLGVLGVVCGESKPEEPR